MHPSGTIFGVPLGFPNRPKNGKKRSRKASETRPHKKKLGADATGCDFLPQRHFTRFPGGPEGAPGPHFWTIFHEISDVFRIVSLTLVSEKSTEFALENVSTVALHA